MRFGHRLRPALGGLAVAVAGFARASEPDCVPQTQVDVTKIAQQVILVGEAHGTVEIPQFTLGLVCSLLRAGKSVILGVEHGGEQQASLNRYLMSAGSPADRQGLLEGNNWRLYSDGRGSVAMFELIDGMRRFRSQGQRVAVLAIDSNENLDVPQDAAEQVHVLPADNAILNDVLNEAMADHVIVAAVLFRPYVVVVLAGYSHTSTAFARTGDPMIMDYKPMGQVVNARLPTFTIGIETGGGAHAYNGKAVSLAPGPLYVSGTNVAARVRIDHLTPSLPARDALR